MPEEFRILSTNKNTMYVELCHQLSALVEGETDQVANMANIAAALRQVFGFFWVGFYRVQGEQLVLGPFQGPVACTRIARGKGVCGTAWEKNTALIVPDVDLFPGHIACNSASKSEIVVPLKNAAGEIWGVLDVDSDRPDAFDDTDRRGLEQICRLLTTN